MEKVLFNELKQSLLEAGAIARREAVPSRCFDVRKGGMMIKNKRPRSVSYNRILKVLLEFGGRIERDYDNALWNGKGGVLRGFVETGLEALANLSPKMLERINCDPLFIRKDDHTWVLKEDHFCNLSKRDSKQIEGNDTTRKFIPVSESFERWRKDPEYLAAYDALEDEFSLVHAMINARVSAGLTQEQVAQRMGTTQAALSRLEGGKVRPSVRTLKRFAKATGTRIKISFEPEPPTQGPRKRSWRLSHLSPQD